MVEKRDLEEGPIEPVKKTKKELLAEEREIARIQREADKEARRLHAEQQKQERELQRENERKERELAKAEREKEKERLRKEKEREKEEAKAQREREKERVKEEKERQKELLKEQKLKELQAQQPRLNTFFTVRRKEDQAEVPVEAATKSDYHTSFLPYHIKATCTMHANAGKPQSPSQDCLAWLASQPRVSLGPYLSTAAFKQGLQLGHQTDKLMERLRVKHIDFFETTRPTFIGTTADLDPQTFMQLSLDATQPLLETVDYEYDSDLEWTPGDDDDVELLDDEQSEEEGDASDVESFLASDDENAMFSRRAPVATVDPMIKWNDHTDSAFFDQFKAIVIDQAPIQSGEYLVPSQKPVAPQKPDLPSNALSEILKGIQGHTGTKTLLLETLYHELHPKFASLTRTGLRSLIDSHAKREKNQWVVLEDKHHLMESSN